MHGVPLPTPLEKTHAQKGGQLHVFYQLLSGGSAADKSQLGVTQANDFELLRGGGRVLTLAGRGASDANDYAEMRQA